VNEQVSSVAKAWRAADPAANHDRDARAMNDFRYRMAKAGTAGLVLFAIVASVVLLAAVNVAHLLLARALARGPEMALRMALGARRALLARQLLIENLFVSLLSLAAGLALAAGIALLLPRLLVSEPAMLVQVGSDSLHFQIDWRVFLFASVMAMSTMLLLALVPLRQVARREIVSGVQAAAVTRTGSRVPMARRAALWLQIAISFALLVSTGTLVRSFLNTRLQSIGLTRNQVLLAWTQDPDPDMRQEIVNRLSAIPGVERVAYAIRAPLSLSEGGIAVKAVLPSHPELRDPIDVKFNAVSPDFLDVIGTRVIRGRGFTQSDDQNGPAAVIINQAMAQKYWPAQDPIGKIVKLTGSFKNAGEARVVGVTENAPINQIGEIPEPYLYVPFHHSDFGEVTFAMQTGLNAMSLARPARDALIHIHPLLDPMMVTSLPELIRYSAGEYQMMAELVTALGAIGLALTIVGLYGYLAFRVTQRRREIGIRMALGASREATSLLVFRDTAGMALIGLALGVVLAVGAARLESSLVFGVSPLNPLSIAGALGMVALAIAAASWLPARRAASIDPMQALRTE
jgi:predicted permease